MLLSHVGPTAMKTGLRNLREPSIDLSGFSATCFWMSSPQLGKVSRQSIFAMVKWGYHFGHGTFLQGYRVKRSCMVSKFT